jgi:ATP-dependent DNA helicase PIF1
MTYKSIDSITNQDTVNYPTKFFSLKLPGLPPHNLQLKYGSVIMMLRNINQPHLCNVTRLAAKKIMNNVIEANILKEKYKGEDVLIPRIPLIPNDIRFIPFDFKRLQFLVRLAFAMSINKFKRQSLSVYGLNNGNQWRNCGGGASAPSDHFLKDKGLILPPPLR